MNRGYALAFAAWALFTAVQAAALSIQEQVPLFAAVFGAGTYFGLLLLLAAPLWRVNAWLGDRRLSIWVLPVAHLGLMVVSVTLWLGAYHGLHWLLAGRQTAEQAFSNGGLWLVQQALITYTLVVAGIVSLQSQSRLEQQRQRESELRALAQQAELRALRAQLRPHFIFNVLNSIYGLIPVSPDKAQRMVERVAELIRDTLDVTDQKFIPLEQELALIDRYLEVEAERLGDRLTVEKDVAPASGEWLVPPLILQPLVENAIKHGIARRTEPGLIRISAQPEGATLVVRIANTAAERVTTARDGKGMWITRNRLETTYGSTGGVELTKKGGFMEVTVTGTGGRGMSADIKVLIVDDEPPSRKMLSSYADRHPGIARRSVAESGRAAVEAIERDPPDIVLLDIEMPELDGFGVLAEVERRGLDGPMIVFVTAYERYAVRAFDIHAVDYLLKPVSYERFETAIDRCLAGAPKPLTPVQGLLEDALYYPPQRLLIRDRGRITPVAVDDVDWVEANGDYVNVHVGPQSYLLERGLSEMADLLGRRGFARVHRGAIVNLSRIRELRPLGSGRYELVLDSGRTLTVSRSFSHQFRGTLL